MVPVTCRATGKVLPRNELVVPVDMEGVLGALGITQRFMRWERSPRIAIGSFPLPWL
jgi:hypothetical protein